MRKINLSVIIFILILSVGCVTTKKSIYHGTIPAEQSDAELNWQLRTIYNKEKLNTSWFKQNPDGTIERKKGVGGWGDRLSEEIDLYYWVTENRDAVRSEYIRRKEADGVPIRFKDNIFKGELLMGMTMFEAIAVIGFTSLSDSRNVYDSGRTVQWAVTLGSGSREHRIFLYFRNGILDSWQGMDR